MSPPSDAVLDRASGREDDLSLFFWLFGQLERFALESHDCPGCERPIAGWEAVVQELRVELRRVHPDDPLHSSSAQLRRQWHAACWVPQEGWAVVTHERQQDVAPDQS